jgi:putative tricarboxylic transport membrane protein
VAVQSAALNWRATTVFADRGQLRLVLAVLWPMGVYVAADLRLGIYVASFVLIAYFMRRHGRYGWPRHGRPWRRPCRWFFFLVFERWFLVPLPKGPLERLLGL